MSWLVFDTCQGEKKQEVGGDGWGGQIGSCEETVGKKRGGTQFDVSIANKAEGEICINAKKHQNQQIQNDSNQTK